MSPGGAFSTALRLLRAPCLLVRHSCTQDFYIQHTQQEGNFDAQLLFNYDNLYWGTTVLLANLTDQGAYHFQAQYFLKYWVCGTNNEPIQYTKLGRAWNSNDGKLGTTANAVYLSNLYGQIIRCASCMLLRDGGLFGRQTAGHACRWCLMQHELSAPEVACFGLGHAEIRPLCSCLTPHVCCLFPHNRKKDQAKSQRYICWARAQTRYMLGESGQSFVGGFGKQPPRRIQNMGASCGGTPAAPLACSSANLFTTRPNPHTVFGGLVEASNFTDTFPDVRTSNTSRVAPEYNAGFTGALAGLNEAPGTWDMCLQGWGVLTKDRAVCQASI